MADRRALLPGTEDDEWIVESTRKPLGLPFVGCYEDGTIGDINWLCSRCGNVVFELFVPTVQLAAASYRCSCGQVNRFKNPT
jgi:hypothetical protein